jgi:hypothetical protein
MDGTDVLTERERRLAEVQTVQHTLEEVRLELDAYRAVLGRKLAWLRDNPESDKADADDDTETPGILPMLRNKLARLGGEKSRSERRTSRRRLGNPISIVISDADASAEPASAWITDRSSHGLGLWADDEEPVGAILSIRPAQGEEWTRVVVRHCRQERGNWVMGCQFVGPICWKRLKMFG